MGKLVAFVLVVVLLVGGAGYYYYLVSSSRTANSKLTPAKTGQSPISPATAENKVNMNNFKFFPETITIQSGEAVTWANMDNSSHSATADDNSFDTKVFPQGESKTITFSEPGTYTYHCSLHPTMTGTVIVE